MARSLGSVRAFVFMVIGVGMLFSSVVEADNPCYAECVQDCLNTCSFIGCAACPAICGIHNTCKKKNNLEINSEAVAVQKDTIDKNFVGVVEGNPCYAECVQDCLNTCSFIGCAACPAICGTHNTCKKKNNLEINSVKPKEAVAVQKDNIDKNFVEVVEYNPCYAECVQYCYKVCVIGCTACPTICDTDNTCRKKKNLDINSGKPEDVAKTTVRVESRKTLHKNSVADE